MGMIEGLAAIGFHISLRTESASAALTLGGSKGEPRGGPKTGQSPIPAFPGWGKFLGEYQLVKGFLIATSQLAYLCVTQVRKAAPPKPPTDHPPTGSEPAQSNH